MNNSGARGKSTKIEEDIMSVVSLLLVVLLLLLFLKKYFFIVVTSTDIATDSFARSYLPWIENVVGRTALRRGVILHTLQTPSQSRVGQVLSCWTATSPRAAALNSRLAFRPKVWSRWSASLAGLSEGCLHTRVIHCEIVPVDLQ